jgi:hypothetical protein
VNKADDEPDIKPPLVFVPTAGKLLGVTVGIPKWVIGYFCCNSW